MGRKGEAGPRARGLGASVAGAALVLGLIVPVSPEAASAQEVVQPAELTPVQTDDPLLEDQWHLERTRVREAWALTQGSSQVTIAVIDTGVDPRHRDLAGALWSNPDGGGAGFDYLRWVRTTHVSPDQDWHGTAVAGVAAARSNDGYGMAGVAPGVKVMVRRIYASTSGSAVPTIVGATEAPRAIRDAVTDGADVILLTWGSDQPDPALFEAIRTAGVPVVAAAGNDGWDLSGTGPKRYPAAYKLPNLVTVAATDRDRQLFSDGTLASNFGADTVDLAAPGQHIVSLVDGGGHAYFFGTSFAAPQVAGALALGRSLAPGASTSELVGTLVSTARGSSGLTGRVISGGELDVLAFLQSLDRPVCDPGLPPAMFDDYDNTNVHADNVACVVFHRISQGVAPGLFAPSRRITRGEMASFLARTLVAAGYEPPPVPPVAPSASGSSTGEPIQVSEVIEVPPRRFTDTGGSVHADAIDLVAIAGVAQGRSDGTFGPGERVSRAQMATFVVRTVELLTDQSFTDERVWFDDTTGHFHERNINVARGLGITLGGTDPRRFEPERTMTRAQMASFVARTLDALGRRGIDVSPVPS
jgi:serine protease